MLFSGLYGGTAGSRAAHSKRTTPRDQKNAVDVYYCSIMFPFGVGFLILYVSPVLGWKAVQAPRL